MTRARATRRAERRRAAVLAPAGATPGSVRIRAAGTTTTRRPALWARQPRSRSAPTSPKEVSQPRRSTSRSRSTSEPANGTPERVAGPVVLALVGLAGRGPRQQAAAAGGADGERPQHVRVAGIEVLGADDAGRGRAAPGVDERDEGVGLGGGAHRQQPREGGGRAVDLVVEQGAVGGGAQGGARVDGQHRDRHAVAAAGRVDDGGEVGVEGDAGRSPREGRRPPVRSSTRSGVGARATGRARRRAGRPGRGVRRVMTTAVTVGSTPSGVGSGRGAGHAGRAGASHAVSAEAGRSSQVIG